MRGRQLLWIIGLGLTGCLGPAPADEFASAGAAAPIETQVTWKAPGQACAAGFVQLGVDPAAGTDARLAACVHHSFCEARPWTGDYCAATPKSVLTTSAATFWSDFLVSCPAIGRLVPGTSVGTAEIRIPDANAPGGHRVFGVDAEDVHARPAAAGGYEPCLTNPDGMGLRDPSCDGGAGTVCSVEGDAVVECVSTWVDDRRGGQSVQVQRVEALSRDACASGICEEPRAAAVACQEDRALLPPSEILQDGAPALGCGPGRSLVDVAGGKMCLAPSYCAAQAPGLYCDGAPSGVRDTRVWGDASPSDAVAPGALVVAGSVAVQCGRDAQGRATTTLFPCASGTCVGNGVGFGCVDTSCELSNDDTDLEALYWSGNDDAIAAVEGAYCSEIHDALLLSCQLVQVYDARLDAFVIRLLPESFRRCTGSTPVCAHNDAGVADACVAADASAAD